MNQPTIIITGGGQGIGKFTTLELLKANYCVAVWEYDDEAIEQFNEESYSPQLLIVKTDISKEEDIVNAISQTLRKFGKIDGLINNAMIQNNKPIQQLSVDEWNRVISVNLTGAFLCSKHVADELSKNAGSIINICSTRALQSEANTEAYSASKGGLLALTHALAVSLGPKIRVNAISPGWIDVSAIKKKSKAQQVSLSETDHSQHPAGRVGGAKDISNMILFLLNPENDFITGQNFVIDGGMTKKMIYEE